MNREIKFRAYWAIVKKMVYFHNARYDVAKYANKDRKGEYGIFIPSIDGGVYMGENISMQFIDKKDKNGKDIYEGDIVTAIMYETGEKWCGEIKYSNCAFVLQDRWIIHFDNFEVVGNIYENPELLPKKEERKRKKDD